VNCDGSGLVIEREHRFGAWHDVATPCRTCEPGTRWLFDHHRRAFLAGWTLPALPDSIIRPTIRCRQLDPTPPRNLSRAARVALVVAAYEDECDRLGRTPTATGYRTCGLVIETDPA
jgi:hypothetical protein